MVDGGWDGEGVQSYFSLWCNGSGTIFRCYGLDRQHGVIGIVLHVCSVYCIHYHCL